MRCKCGEASGQCLRDGVRYDADTLPGSSGSPVYDGAWQHVVALAKGGRAGVKSPKWAGNTKADNIKVQGAAVSANDVVPQAIDVPPKKAPVAAVIGEPAKNCGILMTSILEYLADLHEIETLP